MGLLGCKSAEKSTISDVNSFFVINEMVYFSADLLPDLVIISSHSSR